MNSERIHFHAAGNAGLGEMVKALGLALDVEIVEAKGAENSHPSIQAEGRTLIWETSGAKGREISEIEITQPISGAPWLKERKISLPLGVCVQPLVSPGGEILATSKAGSVWARERRGAELIDHVALPLPAFNPDRAAFHSINSISFGQLLPVIQFIREVTGADGWQSSIKACFMFDDLNLHACSYGYVDYKKLLADAQKNRYHVSFATIPLDSWFTSSKSAGLLRRGRDHLSLLVHGNDHVKQELARAYTGTERSALVAQALSRIERLERDAGVEVCRVMAAPHGACSQEMMAELARFGFHAACISHGSVAKHNSGQPWVNSIGCRPAEIVAGLPIISRFGMASANRESILWAVYLGQPIIPVGHHQDVANGLSHLSSLANEINSLGAVQWLRTEEIARNHYQFRIDGETMRVRPYSVAFKVQVPESVRYVEIEPVAPRVGSPLDYTMSSPRSVKAGEVLEIVANRPRQNPGEAPRARKTLWPIARRFASEMRDYIKPLVRPGRAQAAP